MRYSPGKVAGVLFFLAATQFVLILMVAEALYPGYSIAQNYISDLGIGPSAMLFNLSVVLLGGLMVVGAVFLQQAFHNKVLMVLLLMASIGSIGVGIFPENLEPMHSSAASLIFLFGGLSTMYSSTLMKRPYSLMSIVLGLVSLVASVLFMLQWYGGLSVGGMERMIVYPIMIWILGFGGYLLASPEEA